MTGLLGLAGLLCLELTLDGAGGVLERAGVGDTTGTRTPGADGGAIGFVGAGTCTGAAKLNKSAGATFFGGKVLAGSAPGGGALNNDALSGGGEAKGSKLLTGTVLNAEDDDGIVPGTASKPSESLGGAPNKESALANREDASFTTGRGDEEDIDKFSIEVDERIVKLSIAFTSWSLDAGTKALMSAVSEGPPNKEEASLVDTVDTTFSTAGSSISFLSPISSNS